MGPPGLRPVAGSGAARNQCFKLTIGVAEVAGVDAPGAVMGRRHDRAGGSGLSRMLSTSARLATS
jgi:hypothetical protein